MIKRPLVLAAVAAATVLAAGAAQAGGRVDWSIGINLPPVAAVVSAPGYYAPRAYYAPPAYYAPSAYYAPPVYTVPRYYPPRVVYAPRYYPPARWAGYRDGWRDARWHR